MSNLITHLMLHDGSRDMGTTQRCPKGKAYCLFVLCYHPRGDTEMRWAGLEAKHQTEASNSQHVKWHQGMRQVRNQEYPIPYLPLALMLFEYVLSMNRLVMEMI